ncbi:MAG: hypothetical protein PHC51_04945 [bacterium]|nr:hypothetical protein [bacterium]
MGVSSLPPVADRNTPNFHSARAGLFGSKQMQKNIVIGIFVAGAFILGFWGEDLAHIFDKNQTTETTQKEPIASKPEAVGTKHMAKPQAATIQAGSKDEMDRLYRPAVTTDRQDNNPGSAAVNTSAGDWKSFAESVSASSPRQIEDSRRAQQNLYFQKLREQMAELKLKENDSSDPVSAAAPPSDETTPAVAEEQAIESDDQQNNYEDEVEGNYVEEDMPYDDQYDYSYE